MSVWEIIIGSVLIVFSLLIIAVVLLQEGRQANLGAIAGAADSFMEKGKARGGLSLFFVIVYNIKLNPGGTEKEGYPH